MTDQDFGRGPGNVHPAPARTPYPRRLLLVGRVKPGEEVRVRYWQARFPHDAAAEAGVDAVEAFVGSGYYAMSFEIGGADVQRVLAAYFTNTRLREFHDHLGRFVEGLPDQPFAPGDTFHDAPAAGETTSHATSGALPFAASMYRWRSGDEPQTGDDPSQPPPSRS